MPGFTVLIPARMASTRLPGKPLADIAGQPMVVRVAQRVARGVPAATRVVVATDSTAIVQACQTHQVQALMTRPDHPSGSDRLAEACALLQLPDDAIVVNVQGDEPLIDPALVQATAQLLQQHPDAVMSTAAHPVQTLEEWLNPNVVKLVLGARQQALYFSRAAIPCWRDAPDPVAPPVPTPLRHIGLYAYRVGFLRRFPELPVSPLEQCEALEQLRVLWHGHEILVHVTPDAPGAGVDTPQDLERVRRVFAL